MQKRKPPKPRTVAELIAELQKFPPDAQVFAMTSYGPRPARALRTDAGGQVHVLGTLAE